MTTVRAILMGLFLLSGLFPVNVFAKTFVLDNAVYHRKLKIVRHYEISAAMGVTTVAYLPAFFSFKGQTNRQTILSSDLVFSQDPDSLTITADNLGMPRHNFRMLWTAPGAEVITVDQTMDVDLSWSNTLYTAARLPYDAEVLKKYAISLGPDQEEGINPDNPGLKPICEDILKRSRTAEEAVTGVCDWINDNIKFVKGERTSDEALAQKQGSCTPMSLLSCSLLRKMGIPCEPVSAKSIGGNSGHTFIEVFYPDAGWIFYDLSNWNRGFKSLDHLMVVGWAFRSGTLQKTDWTQGYFCEEADDDIYSEKEESAAAFLRDTPLNVDVLSVRVVPRSLTETSSCRWKSIKEMTLDPNTGIGE